MQNISLENQVVFFFFFLQIIWCNIIYAETWKPGHFRSNPAAVPGIMAKCGLNSRAESVHLECVRSGSVRDERALLSPESSANNKGRSQGKEGKGGGALELVTSRGSNHGREGKAGHLAAANQRAVGGSPDSTGCSFHKTHTTQLVSLAATFLLIPLWRSEQRELLL